MAGDANQHVLFPALGENLRRECVKRLQNIVASSWGGVNRSNYVNHGLDRRVGLNGTLTSDSWDTSHDSETLQLFKVTATVFSRPYPARRPAASRALKIEDASPLLLTMYARIL